MDPFVSSAPRDGLVGRCHLVEIKVNGVSVRCLVDTGSQVTLFSESLSKDLFDAHHLPGAEVPWLTLRGANGLNIPISDTNREARVGACRHRLSAVRVTSSQPDREGVGRVACRCAVSIPAQSEAVVWVRLPERAYSPEECVLVEPHWECQTVEVARGLTVARRGRVAVKVREEQEVRFCQVSATVVEVGLAEKESRPGPTAQGMPGHLQSESLEGEGLTKEQTCKLQSLLAKEGGTSGPEPEEGLMVGVVEAPGARAEGIPANWGWDPHRWRERQEQDEGLATLWTYLERNKFPGVEERQGHPVRVKKLLGQWKRLKLRDGVICRSVLDSRTHEMVSQVVVPAAQIQPLLQAYHDQLGHQGQERTVSLLRRHFFWSVTEAPATTTEWVHRHHRQLHSAYEKVSKHLDVAAKKNKRLYDRTAEAPCYPENGGLTSPFTPSDQREDWPVRILHEICRPCPNYPRQATEAPPAPVAPAPPWVGWVGLCSLEPLLLNQGKKNPLLPLDAPNGRPEEYLLPGMENGSLDPVLGTRTDPVGEDVTG
ncbi:hypothetical protein G5714_004032 [Onychostoma macrolepis]|uniref:Gypsy retrotransposon integrase-like protein 1 n=1 Tax=Onychostoma macrolepis TaxID=369639 RepID=A0A7J6DB59_9TELE|nr:hypothetical protein G5714_004032 [Onychostoma macrolepis]